jgi:hypothetical protein
MSNQPPQGPPEGWEPPPKREGSERPTEPQWPTQGPQWRTQPPTQPERWQPRPPELYPTQPLSEAERKAWLAEQVDEHIRRGWQIESRTENLASLRFGRRINHVLHFLITLATFGLWALVWIYLAIFEGEKHKTISTADAGKPPPPGKPFYQERSFLIAAAVILFFILLYALGDKGASP